MAVGSPGDNSSDGHVGPLRCTATGPTTTAALTFGPATTGISTTGGPPYGSASNS